jgi:bacillithiol biosynthesis deacetylase BshB1
MTTPLQNSTQVDILAVGAHPDDVELCMAGALLAFVAQGRQTAIVDLTRGELSTRGTPEIRARESEEAAVRLGLRFRANLELPDGDVRCDDAARRALVRILRNARPTLVFTHHPADAHPDHRNAAQLVAESVHHCHLANYDRESGLARHFPAALIHFLPPSTVAPTFYVDISAHFEAKWRVIAAHESQFHRPGTNEPETYLTGADFFERRRAADRFRGDLAGCYAAEGFVTEAPLKISDPATFFSV